MIFWSEFEDEMTSKSICVMPRQDYKKYTLKT